MIDTNPPLAKLICAITFSPSVKLDNIIIQLENAFGQIDDKSNIIEFIHTDYYTPEMGPDLKKLLVSFFNPFKAENLWMAKHTTNDIERMFSDSGKRQANLDPGYLETSKLVLASTKNFSHRICLNQGIYAEVTLLYADGKFQKLPWTYPDYLEKSFLDFLSKTRENYKDSLH